MVPQRYVPSCFLCALLLCLVAVASSAALEAEALLSDVEWPWKPQLDLPVPDAFFTGDAALREQDDWLVLARVGAPLRIQADSTLDLQHVLELVSFMQADGSGQCPFYTTPYRRYYYAFHHDELALLYGEARWRALQQLQEPQAWTLVMSGAVGPDVRAAEHFIARLASVDPPGRLQLRMQPHHLGQSSSLLVPLGDFRVLSPVVDAGRGVRYRFPRLTVEGDATVRRRLIQQLVRAKAQQSALVAEFDEATAAAQDELRAALEELRAREQVAYDTHARFRLRYQRFLLDRQARRAGTAEGEESTTEAKGAKATALPRTQPRVRVTMASARTRTAEGRQAVSCRKVQAAWRTLRSGGVRTGADTRVKHLRRLHTRHSCPETLPPLESGSARGWSTDSANSGHGATAERVRALWRANLVEMQAQRSKSGRSPTVAQLYAVLYGLWAAQRNASGVTMAEDDDGSSYSPSSPDAASMWLSFRVADASDLAVFAAHFLESGTAVDWAGGKLPRFVSAELHYIVAVLQLVTRPAGPARDPTDPAEAHVSADAVPRGLLHLYEAMSLGSHHAAGALATLREHGIFTRQHAKAAMMLLLRSMKHAPSHLLRELLFPTLHTSVGKAARASSSTAVAAAQRRRVDAQKLDVSRLLRFEQFYAVDHTLSEVDDPFMTRRSISTLVAVSNENTHTSDEAPELEDAYREAEAEHNEGAFEGSITVRLGRRLLKANMLLTGFKDTQRNPQEAQCELLVILRRLGYFCDLDLHTALSSERGRAGAIAEPLKTIIGVRLPHTCAEHNSELRGVLGNDKHTVLACPNGSRNNAILRSQPHPWRRVPISDTLFSLLQHTLLSLSYVHLLHTHQYSVSHLYATLALEMSLRLQQDLVQHVHRVRLSGVVHHNSDDDGGDAATAAAGNASSKSPLAPYEGLAVVAESADDVAWAAAKLVEHIVAADDDSSTKRAKKKATHALHPPLSMDERAVRVLQRCRTVADSPFVDTEALQLLAVTRWVGRDRLVGNVAANVSAFAQRISQWTAEPFALLAGLLAHGEQPVLMEARQFQKDLTELIELRRSTVAGLAKVPANLGSMMTDSPVDVHALFLVCLAAMKRWKSDFTAVHLLDSTSYSVRRTDPFILASFLLRLRSDITGQPLISIPYLRDLIDAASPQWLGTTPHFAPLVDDTVETYGARLLRFAMRHIHLLEPSVELLNSGGYGAGEALMDSTAQTSSLLGFRRHGVFDDAPPRRLRLRALRRVKQQTMENADLQPLLYASDTHEYYNASRWTYMGTLLNAAYNALLYPFTFTTSESFLVEMEEHVQIVTAAERKAWERRASFAVAAAAPTAAGETSPAATPSAEQQQQQQQQASESAAVGVFAEDEATSVSAFMDAFAKHAVLREHFIACQLFSFTLESGMPEGFSLMFLEAADRSNPFLGHLVAYLADTVFGRWTASVWTEHHLSAQWQREKPDIAFDGPVFALSTRSPFRYASVDARQELFGRVTRWQAAQADVTQPDGVVVARDRLLWCSGLLTRRVFHSTARVYAGAHEGALFPAADVDCVAELARVLALGSQQAGRTEQTQMQQNATALLKDVSERLAYAYDLVEQPPPRRAVLSESDYRDNVSSAEATVALSERRHAQKKRFLRASSQLVEPWNRQSRDISVESLAYGEGTYYNSRLHRVSGYRWGSRLWSWWLAMRQYFPF